MAPGGVDQAAAATGELAREDPATEAGAGADHAGVAEHDCRGAVEGGRADVGVGRHLRGRAVAGDDAAGLEVEAGVEPAAEQDAHVERGGDRPVGARRVDQAVGEGLVAVAGLRGGVDRGGQGAGDPADLERDCRQAGGDRPRGAERGAVPAADDVGVVDAGRLRRGATRRAAARRAAPAPAARRAAAGRAAPAAAAAAGAADPRRRQRGQDRQPHRRAPHRDASMQTQRAAGAALRSIPPTSTQTWVSGASAPPVATAR